VIRPDPAFFRTTISGFTRLAKFRKMRVKAPLSGTRILCPLPKSVARQHSIQGPTCRSFSGSSISFRFLKLFMPPACPQHIQAGAQSSYKCRSPSRRHRSIIFTHKSQSFQRLPTHTIFCGNRSSHFLLPSFLGPSALRGGFIKDQPRLFFSGPPQRPGNMRVHKAS